MPEHVNEQQMREYRDRTLAQGEMVAVDAHLGGCEPCRNKLAALADKTATASVLSGIDQARFRHLSYEQMDDWVEDRLDQGGRELVMAHIGACAACARQLIAYQEYAPKMAAPIQTMMMPATQPLKVKQPWWSFLTQPQYALGAAALVAMIVIAPWSRHSSPPEQMGAIVAPASTAVESTIPAQNSSLSSPLTSAALNTTELDALPDSLRVGAKEVVTAADDAPRPASLKGLNGNGDSTLEYPFAEVVGETQPVMRWKAFGDTYDVSLSDARGLISRRTGLKDTQWTPPSALLRDHVYTWEVESGGQKHRGTFRVLDESQRQELEKVRAAHGDSHLVIGAVSEQLGLLTPAKREFEAMAKDSAQAQQAAKLLSHIETLRK
jgi:anti-sigma factor RsiW